MAEYLLILFSLGSSQLEWGVDGLVAIISGITFGISTILARMFADAVVKTGVLANTELGQSVVDEV